MSGRRQFWQYCYFCDEPADKVSLLIQHDDISICDECVDICARLVREYYWNQRYERWKEFGP